MCELCLLRNSKIDWGKVAILIPKIRVIRAGTFFAYNVVTSCLLHRTSWHSVPSILLFFFFFWGGVYTCFVSIPDGVLLYCPLSFSYSSLFAALTFFTYTVLTSWLLHKTSKYSTKKFVDGKCVSPSQKVNIFFQTKKIRF